jgi:hypothetical protein
MDIDVTKYTDAPGDETDILFYCSGAGKVAEAITALIDANVVQLGGPLYATRLANMLASSDSTAQAQPDETDAKIVRFRILKGLQEILGTHGLQFRKMRQFEYVVPDVMPVLEGDAIIALPVYKVSKSSLSS